MGTRSIEEGDMFGTKKKKRKLSTQRTTLLLPQVGDKSTSVLTLLTMGISKSSSTSRNAK